MTTFLAEIGKSLADRWVAVVLTPGLMLIAAVTLAARLGQSHAVDIGQLRTWTDAVAADPTGRNPGALILAVAVLLGVSAAAGLAASALGAIVEHIWIQSGRHWPGRPLTAWRRNRWDRADRAAEDTIRRAAHEAARSGHISVSPQPSAATTNVGRLSGNGSPHPAPVRPRPRRSTKASDVAAAIARRDAICLVKPERPTWIGDRLRATDLRIYWTYDLDLNTAWPRLWTVAPAPLRTDLASARDAYSSAARLSSWGLLYLALSAWWWPAALIAAITLIASNVKARAAANTLADLVETTVDLYGRYLAEQLGIPCDGSLTPEVGFAITTLLRKDSAAASHPAQYGASPPGQGTI